MIRIILFLVLIALAAAGAAWMADQTGDIVLSSGGWRIETTLPVFALAPIGRLVDQPRCKIVVEDRQRPAPVALGAAKSQHGMRRPGR